MNEPDPNSEAEAFQMLSQLERILESDPHIDEVGFIHPSQFGTLIEESGLHQSVLSSKTSDVDATKRVNDVFLNKDHKLGISTDVLLPLYKAAKYAFMAAMRQHRELINPFDNSGNFSSSYTSIESEVMKHSKALLLLSYDFGTAWHSRKFIVSKKHPLSIFMDELHFSALVLSYAPKCEHAWSHRRWVIKSIAGRCTTLQEILGKESELVERIAERSKMNYRAWNHRCWLVPYMSTEQVLHELKKSRYWAGLHVADSSCFHYRRRLMLKILADSNDEQKVASSGCTLEINKLWKEELDWNEKLIKLYVGREALWLHRRFLSLVLIKHFSNDHTGTSILVDNELHLLRSCSTFPDSFFEDHQAQALYSASYILWLVKQIPEFHRIEIQKKLSSENLKDLLNKASPEKAFLWDYLIDHAVPSGDCE
ncbi:hypothetical protein UlMin_030029 [Ulmus minor]